MNAERYCFDGVWDVLEKHGLCDARGSHEYWRVLELWKQQGEQGDIAMFVISHANFIPVPADGSFTVPADAKGSVRLVMRVEVVNGKA